MKITNRQTGKRGLEVCNLKLNKPLSVPNIEGQWDWNSKCQRYDSPRTFLVFILIFIEYGCMGGVIDISKKSKISKRGSNSRLDSNVHFCANVSVKGRNLYILLANRLRERKLWILQETTPLSFLRMHHNSQINKRNLWRVTITYTLKKHGIKKLYSMILLAGNKKNVGWYLKC